MRLRALLLVPAVIVAAVSGGCPRPDDAPPAAVAVPIPAPAAPATAPAPIAAAPPPAASAAPATAPAAIDPASAALPPELVDDGSEDAPDPEPEPPPPPRREVHELAAIAKEAWVLAEPRWSSRKIGYLRAGAIVERRAKPSGWSSCDEGWYRIAPKGYVCVGATATLDIHHPVVEASARRPARDTLPYTYVMSRFPTPPLYARLPTDEEQQKVEPELAGFLRKLEKLTRDPSFVEPPPADPTPSSLLYGRPAPTLANVRRSPDALVIDRARTRSGFALLSTFDHDGRRFGLTTELAVIPIDRTRVIRPSAFHGTELGDEAGLPIAFVKTKHAVRYEAGEGAALGRGEALGWRQAVPLSDEVVTRGGVTYFGTKDGGFVRADQVTRVDPMKQAPAWAASGRKWIDVSILRQSLTAYEGMRPVYTTLVSTGADGLGDPKKTHSTIQGAFLIHTKHVSVTMDGDDAGDEFDLRDVPFVQYFTEGFALHGAYWHDDFGTPRSHGCVNLAPVDAAWLFRWTDPQVPEAWHAALTLKKGTLVHIHP